uniref:Caspase family p20 domain-containing protein n=1 Tax=Apteryx owenii TaxID=8824 RepID=A0A8B9QGD8_APTOW
MADWSMPIGSLGEDVVARLCELLDNASRGWRKLAEVAGAEKRFKCSPRHDPHHGAARVAHGDRGDAGVSDLLGNRPTRAQLPVVLREAGAARSHSPRAGDRHGHRARPARLVHLPCELWGQLHLLQVGPRPGREEQQPQLSKRILPDHGGAADPASATALPLGRRGHAGAGVRSHRQPAAPVPVVQEPAPRGGRAGAPAPGTTTEPLAQPGATRTVPRSGWPPAPLCPWQVKLVTTAERGSYSCRVFNLFHEVWSREVDVEIGPRLFTSGGSWQDGDGGAPERCSPGQLYATDKVALLIGNMHYLHHKHLKAPMVDVHALSSLLRQLDFKVVSLLDLCKAEMQMAVNEFLLLLDKGVYGLLYYAGHGYENFGNSFMVPIDAPGSYTSAHCLCVQRVLRSMQQRHTGLNIFLLDMCRKRNLNDDVIPQVGALQVTANIVFGYATCADAEAYELSQSDLSNGIFVSFLKRWLLEDEKITVLLDKVAEDMGTLEITRGRQALELRSNLSERRALTDPIQPAEGQDESSVRNLQWAKAHVLPESRHLHFDCGVTVQLGFAAEFSNIMIIYTRIVATPKDIAKCEAKLTDIPEELDVDLKFTNKESPEEVGSPLSPTWSHDVPSCCLYSRLCGLQKLRQELVFTVCLQYQYRGMDDFVEERQTVNVGKPLIAKLNLKLGDGPDASAQPNLDASISLPGSEASGSPLSSSPPGSWAAADARWMNTPEENLSPEIPGSHSL